MNEIIEFALNHWFLSSLFTLILVLFIANEIRQRGKGGAALSPQQVVNLMNHDQGVVVDIRSAEAFATGHIIGAINLPQADLESKKSKLNKYKSKPIVLVCPQGLLAGKVSQTLKQAGFEQVYQLAGGVAAWQQEQLPLSK